MRPSRSLAVAATSVLTSLALVGGAVPAEAKPARDRFSWAPAEPAVVTQSQQLRKAVKPAGVKQHLRALQRVADANGGNRASGTPGYAASRDYVVGKLRKAGYRPTVQSFPFVFFDETTPTELQRISPNPRTFVDGEDFLVMEYSGSGDVTGGVVAVDTDFSASATSSSGCDAADFAGFPAGSIALMQRGTCGFADKVANAAAAGAAAAIVFNRGVDVDGDPGSTVLNGTLGEPGAIPAVGTSFAAGVDLGSAQGTTARVKADVVTEERTTWNVFAETAGGRAGNVVMAGAHLDSVTEGPGINDNGSGSAAILEVAEQLGRVSPSRLRNKVRFAWWGAEENGLLGAYHYVEDLVDSNPRALSDIAAYLNFDMVGSPNFARFVYDGDNSTGQGAEGPAGSAQVERLFTSYFRSKALATAPTAFDGRSDYGPFIENGVAAGGLFTGAEDVKTPREALVFGGTAGEPYDACYHQACDDLGNLSGQALDEMSDAIAHAVWTLARSTRLLGAGTARTAADHRTMRGQAVQGDPHASRQ